MSNAAGASRHIVDLPDDGCWDLEYGMDRADRFALRDLAAEVGIDNSSVRKCAIKRDILVEKEWRWINGSRQLVLVTDANGAALLRRWYAK